MSDVAGLTTAFETIYASDTWTGGSGPGSSMVSTVDYRAFVENFILANRIATVTDLGCGDWQFSRHMDWSSVIYVGLDVVPALIERNNRMFGSDRVSFRVSETIDSLPGGDLILVKEVLQHLPNALILAYLQAVRQRYRYALITNGVTPGGGRNGDIHPGDYRPLVLSEPPFDARGSVVLTYFPRSTDFIWQNSVFLLYGDSPVA